MVKCTRCGTRFEGKVNFCTVCGAPVRKETGSKIKYVLIIAGLLIAVGIITVAIFKAGIFNKDDMSEASLENEVQTEVGDEDEGSTYQSNDKDEYIIPDSDREYIQSSDLTKLTDEELTLARNEIYARRGRIFKNAEIREYFMSQSWYTGTIEPDEFSEDMLSNLEKSNVQKIKAEEERRGMWD